MTIRILHIVGIMNVGGLETLLMNIYRNIDKEKIQFDFLVTREEKGIFDDEISSLGGRIYYIPSISKVGLIQYKRNLLDFFQKHREYNIIHCHRDALCSLYLKEAKKAKIPVRIAHSHTTKIIERKSIKGYINILIKNYFKISSVNYATNYYACSKEAAEWLFGKSLKQSVTILKNGIELKKYEYKPSIRRKIRHNLNISEDTFVLGHVGSFTLPKNHKFMISFFNKLKQNNNNVKLLLVGNGELEDEIKEDIKQFGLSEDIIFLGIRNDVNELLMAMDLFIFPSLFEGLGIAVIEAQATGVQCLISPTIPEDVDMGLELIYRCPLNEKLWIEFINNEMNFEFERRSNLLKICENGYDIVQNIHMIEKKYHDLNENSLNLNRDFV